jgi:hypothetical protein
VTISPSLRRAGVGHLGQRRRLAEAADHVALRGALGVAGRGQHHGHRPVLVELGGVGGEAAGLAGGGEQLEQVGAQSRQHRLGLGIAEADVELDHPGPVGADHQARVEHAVEGSAAARHRRDDRPVHEVDELADLERAEARHR